MLSNEPPHSKYKWVKFQLDPLCVLEESNDTLAIFLIAIFHMEQTAVLYVDLPDKD